MAMENQKKPMSEAKKQANARYQAKTIASLACRVKKEQAEAFKKYCSDQGKTSNAVLREFVLQCIGEECVEDSDTQQAE